MKSYGKTRGVGDEGGGERSPAPLRSAAGIRQLADTHTHTHTHKHTQTHTRKKHKGKHKNKEITVSLFTIPPPLHIPALSIPSLQLAMLCLYVVFRR